MATVRITGPYQRYSGTSPGGVGFMPKFFRRLQVERPLFFVRLSSF